MDYERLLKEKLLSLFTDVHEKNAALDILNAYGKARHEQEPCRVRLAILKLSGTELGQIKKYTALAKQDFRDVLAWAEYPRQSKHWSLPDGPEKQKLVEEDRKEYVKWLNT